MSEIRLGDWREALAHVEEVDAIICDPPYSARTHNGHDSGANMANDYIRPAAGRRDTARARRTIDYSSFDEHEIHEFVAAWQGRCRGWFAVMSDSVLCNAWRESFENFGLTGFHPVPCIIRGMTVRMAGDGPSSWAVYLNVARPKRLSKWGTLPGAYLSGQGERIHVGGKPLELMEAILRDYTRPGDLVCDPFAGSGTTGRACQRLGRRFIGSEIDPEAHRVATDRLRGWGSAETKEGQIGMFR